VRAADLDEVAVALLAASPVGIARMRPQLVVARHPHEATESRPEQLERVAQVLGRDPDVAGEREPVVRPAGQRRRQLQVLAMAQVQVGERVQPHPVVRAA
jgi:type II secretory pathway component PulJ